MERGGTDLSLGLLSSCNLGQYIFSLPTEIGNFYVGLPERLHETREEMSELIPLP